MRLLSLRRHSPGLRVLEVQDQDGQVEATGKQIWAQLEEQSVRSKDELDDSCALTFLSPRDALVPQQCSQGAGLALSHPHFFFLQDHRTAVLPSHPCRAVPKQEELFSACMPLFFLQELSFPKPLLNFPLQFARPTFPGLPDIFPVCTEICRSWEPR